MHNEELRNLFSPNVIRMIISRWMRWGGECSMHGRKRDAYRIFVRKP
jgi:hypothetical protein